MNNSNQTFLDLKCSLCYIKPSEIEMKCDTVVCNKCENLNLKEKNPYIAYGKFPFLVLKLQKEHTDRVLYLQQIKEFENDPQIE